MSGFDVGLLGPLSGRVDSFVRIFLGRRPRRRGRGHPRRHATGSVAAGMRRRQLVHRRLMRMILRVAVGADHVIIVRVELLLDALVRFAAIIVRPIAAAMLVVVVRIHVIQVRGLELGKN